MSLRIIEVGPRDGFQPIGPFIPTATKREIIARLHAAGLSEIEIGSFVSPRAVPQMADTPDLLATALHTPGLRPRVLVPTLAQAARALAAGAPMLAFVLSVSEAHNQSNLRRSPAESAQEYLALVASLPKGVALRLNLATAFDCPFDGRVPAGAVLDLAAPLIAACPGAEIALCDTTGRADPAQVADLFARMQARFGAHLAWAFHGHDTYGMGLANIVAALGQGVRIFDSALAGLGGCPFAPGATGNAATEDLIFMAHRMGLKTGCDLQALIAVADMAARLPGAQVGGRARAALAARCSRAKGPQEEECRT